ncbi:MAG: hypothetical protein AAGG07_13385 [Planctomycetota bacterium]
MKIATSVVCIALAASVTGMVPWSSVSAQPAAGEHSGGVAPVFLMNRGAVFSEDEIVATALGASLSELITAIFRGEITDRHISESDRARHSFFLDALRKLRLKTDRPSVVPMVLRSFSPDGDETFLVTVAFMTQRDTGTQIEKIIEFHAYPHDHGYRFRSPFEYRTRRLSPVAMGDVRFYFAGDPDVARAREFASFKREFEARSGNAARDLDYYCFETLDELLGAYGLVYDCARCNWLKEDLGFMDDGGRRFLTGTGNERFVFEFVVDYMRQFCNDEGDLYWPFVYGIAAYYGGYGLGGDDLAELKAQFRQALRKRPHIDFLAEYRKERGSSIQRHFTHFVICAFLCEKALAQHGFDGVMQLAHAGESGERFMLTLDRLLGVNEANFHATVVELIQEMG